MTLKPKTYPFWLRAGISIVLVFHLAVVIVLANGPSVLGRIHQGWILGYANQLGLNQTWNFFSPDPSHIHYLNYVLYFEDEDGEPQQDPIEGFLPEEKREVVVDSSKRRMLHAIRFMSLDESRTEKLLAPWLCSWSEDHPGPAVSRVHIRHIMEVLPNLDQASTFVNRPLEELVDRLPYRSIDYDCRRRERTDR